jgi:hypothetical protein
VVATLVQAEARGKLVVATGVQAEVVARGKATAVLRDGVVGGSVMDGIGMGSSEMRMVAAARTMESSGMVRGVGSGRQRRRGQGISMVVRGGGAGGRQRRWTGKSRSGWMWNFNPFTLLGR